MIRIYNYAIVESKEDFYQNWDEEFKTLNNFSIDLNPENVEFPIGLKSPLGSYYDKWQVRDVEEIKHEMISALSAVIDNITEQIEIIKSV